VFGEEVDLFVGDLCTGGTVAHGVDERHPLQAHHVVAALAAEAQPAAPAVMAPAQKVKLTFARRAIQALKNRNRNYILDVIDVLHSCNTH
jgi:hypothetical protein